MLCGFFVNHIGMHSQINILITVILFTLQKLYYNIKVFMKVINKLLVTGTIQLSLYIHIYKTVENNKWQRREESVQVYQNRRIPERIGNIISVRRKAIYNTHFIKHVTVQCCCRHLQTASDSSHKAPLILTKKQKDILAVFVIWKQHHSVHCGTAPPHTCPRVTQTLPALCVPPLN